MLNEKEVLKFFQYLKFIWVSFIIYADLESLIKKNTRV